MGKIANRVMAGALAASIAGGAGGCSEIGNQVEKWVEGEHATLQHDYDRGFIPETVKKMTEFWQAKGIGMASVKTVILEGAATAACGADVSTSKTHEISVCSDGRIIVPAEAVNDLRNNHGENSRGAIIGILGHEVGHEVINQKPELMQNAPADAKQAHIFEERFATCLSGMAIYSSQEWRPDTEGAKQAFLLADDADHYGSGRDQASAYSWAFEQMDKDPHVDPAKCVNMPPLLP